MNQQKSKTGKSDGAKAKRAKADKSSKQDQSAMGTEPNETPSGWQIHLAIIHPDGKTMEWLNDFLIRLGPEIEKLCNQALMAYPQDLVELTASAERVCKSWPDPYRTDFLEAVKKQHRLGLGVHFAQAQGMSPDSELGVALNVALSNAVESTCSTLAQFVAETSKGKYSAEQIQSLLAIMMLSANVKPFRATEDKIQDYAEGRGRKRKPPIAAETELIAKHFRKIGNLVGPALGLMRKPRETKPSSYGEDARKLALAFVELERSGVHSKRESILDVVCKEHPQATPGYASSEYNSAKARSERKRIGAQINYILAKYKEPAETFAQLHQSGKRRSQRALLEDVFDRHPEIAPGYASLKRDSEEARETREFAGVMIEYHLSKEG